MRVVVVTAPKPVIPLPAAKQHLRVDADDDDVLIAGMVEAATAHLDGPDGWLDRAIGMQTLEARFDAGELDGEMRLPFPPVVDLLSIQCRGVDRVLRPIDLADVELLGAEIATIGPSPWAGAAFGREALRVRYTAGYRVVPAPLQAAILLMVDDLYNNRGTVETGARAAAVAIPMSATVENLLAPFRIWG